MWDRAYLYECSRIPLEQAAIEGDRPVGNHSQISPENRVGRTGISDRIRVYKPPKSKYVRSPIAHQ